MQRHSAAEISKTEDRSGQLQQSVVQMNLLFFALLWDNTQRDALMS